MKLEDIAIIINDVENRFEVDKWEIDGVKIWPFLRIENYMLLSYASVNSSDTKTRSSKYTLKILTAKIRRIKNQIVDFKNNSKLREADILLKSDGVSFTKFNNLWYEKFCDPIIDYYKNSNISTLRLDDFHNFYTPRYSPSVFIQTRIDNIIIKSLLLTKLKKPIFKVEKWGDYEKFINDDFSKKHFRAIYSKEKIRVKIYKIKQLKSFYFNMLQKVKPKVAFVVSYYCDSNMAFILACNDLGIKTIDIQHGVQGEFHLGYSKWNKVPKQGYGSLPDYFMVWSKDESSVIDNWNTNIIKHKTLISGNMFSEIWKDNSNKLVNEYDHFFNKTKKSTFASLLLTLSPGMITDELMSETWRLLKSIQNKYNLYIRLHPVMMKDKSFIASKLREKEIFNFEIEKCSELPLYTVLRNVDIHITVQSSVVIEASEFSVPSLITSEYGATLYRKQIEDGIAYFLGNYIKMKELIEKLVLNKTNFKTDKKNKNRYIFEEINQIING